MKSLKTLILIALTGAFALAGAPALAHGGDWDHDGDGGHWGHGGRWGGGHFRGYHRDFGVVIGAPTFFWPIDPFPNYYAPPVVVQPPPVYIQQGQPAGYSYYCNDPPGYYPQVPACPGGWQRLQVTPVQ